MWLSLGLLTIGVPGFVTAGEPPLYFEEVLWAGSDRSGSDEWFELRSLDDAPRSLTGWWVSVLTTAGEQPLASLDGLSVAPHGSILVASHDQRHRFTAGESALALDPDLIVPGLTLSNTRLKLTLYAPGNVTPIDEAGTGRAPPAGGTKPPRSMERIDPSLNGSLSSSWRSAATRTNLDEGTTLLANPAHAGAATVHASGSLAIDLDRDTLVSLSVTDPDGEDDLVAVSLTCGQESVQLNDEGIRQDSHAGDRWYSGRLGPPDGSLTRCRIEARDRSGLTTAAELPVTLRAFAAPIRVNEVLSDPGPSGDEFIELENRGPTTVPLTGWRLDDRPDGGSKPFSLTGFSINGFSFLVLTRAATKLVLNNAGDQVVLTDPDGTVVDTVTVPSATTGLSWSREAAGWAWVTPTPAARNAVPTVAPPVAPPIVTSPPTQSVAIFHRALPGSTATLQGRVVARVGLFGSSYGLIADPTGVAQVLWSGHQPALPALGSVVRVTGRRANTRSPRILISDQADIQAVADDIPLSPSPLSVLLDQRATDQSFVTGLVTVVRVNERSLTVRDTRSDRLLSLQWSPELSEALDWSVVQPGATLAVTGILADAAASEPTLTLRVASDLSQVAGPGPTVTESGLPNEPVESSQPVIMASESGPPNRSVRQADPAPSTDAAPLVSLRTDAVSRVIDRLTATLASFEQQTATLLATERAATMERTLGQSRSATESGMVGLAALTGALLCLGEVRRIHRLLSVPQPIDPPGG
jgi:hypothetical protein